MTRIESEVQAALPESFHFYHLGRVELQPKAGEKMTPPVTAPMEMPEPHPAPPGPSQSLPGN